MSADKFHINKKGDVKPCNADVRACRFGDAEHFTNETEAREAAEARMSAENNDDLGTVSRKVSELVPEKPYVKENFKKAITAMASRPNMNSSMLQEVGEVFELEVKRKLSFNPFDHELTYEEYVEIQAVNRKLFSALVENGGDMPDKAYGVLSDELNEAIKILPNNVKASLKKKDITTRYLHGNNKAFNGTYSLRHFSTPIPATEQTRYIDIPEDAPEDSIISTNRFKQIDELRNPVEGHRMYVKSGDGPEVESRWLGPPSSYQYKNYKKVANHAEVYVDGEIVKINKPLYKFQEKGYFFGSEISLKRDVAEEYKDSVLLHEYCHAIQYTSEISSRRQEKEMFNKLAGKRSSKNPYRASYHTGFPEAYMGHPHGLELFTVSTEGLFHPSLKKNGFLYGSNQGENATQVRRWITGLWLSLANTPLPKPREKPKPRTF